MRKTLAVILAAVLQVGLAVHAAGEERPPDSDAGDDS